MTKTSSKVSWIGIDVAKDSFDAAFIEDSFSFSESAFAKIKAKSFANNKNGVKKLFAWLNKSCPASNYRIVMESTGVYSLKLHDSIAEYQPNCLISIVNALKTSNFNKSLGLRSKTDSLDAKALAVFGKERKPRLYQRQAQHREELKALGRERIDYVKQLVALKNRIKEGCRSQASLAIMRSLKLIKEALEKALKDIIKAIKLLIKENQDLKQELKLLTSVDGVGFITAITVMGEFGNLDRFTRARQLSSYAGLSPRRYESGKSVLRKTRLSKQGNGRVRAVLYMAAMAAARSPYFAGFRKKLLDAGKTKMAVIGAIMRKLLVVMRAVIISKQPFDRFRFENA